MFLCAVSSPPGVEIQGLSVCEDASGGACTPRVAVTGKAAQDNAKPLAGKLQKSGTSGNVTLRASCRYSSYYIGYVPRGYYRCGSPYFLQFNTLALVYSHYCYRRRVYGMVYTYAYTSGTCRIRAIRYAFYTNSVFLRVYYCC